MKANYLPLIEFVQDVLSESSKIRDFDDLDETQRDQFYSLYLKTVDDDTELYLGDDGLAALRKYLMNYDADYVPDILKSLRSGMYDKTYELFNDLLGQEIADSRANEMRDHGRHRYVDRINGEVRWI